MDAVQLKEALMDRLNFLENRIHQLSQELDNGGSSSGGGGHESRTAITFAAEEQKQMLYSSSHREVGYSFRSGSSNYRSQLSQKKTVKTMESMQAATTEAIDKRAAAIRHNEKRRMDRACLYKRWFQVGC